MPSSWPRPTAVRVREAELATVGIVPHHARPEAARLAHEAIAWLIERGHGVRVPADDAKEASLEQWSHAEAELSRGLDLALSLGGDGTMLRTVDLVCAEGVPVLGVNVGHLGYLTQVDPADLTTALARFFAGSHDVEERMTLEVTLRVEGQADLVRSALNEAVLEKTLSGHTVRFAVSIDGEFFTTYAADGVIVATPTGSTAYNLSARGPIASPRLRALLMTPVSPHMLFDRTLVLHPSEDVSFEVLPGPPAAAVVDGRSLGSLPPGATLSCRAGTHPARLVTFGERDFHRILKTKFGLADR